jgi:ribose-phosphate pyrophosphokinase
MNIIDEQILVVGNTSDSYTAIDIAYYLRQKTGISDIISLKVFKNSEFCPRFTLFEEDDFSRTGESLKGKTIILVSAHNDFISRNELAMRNLILARAARDNGAKQLILVEPDLFYSAQDRGPRREHGKTKYKRSREDMHKFNGQPFTARLYAQLLKNSGVDTIVTVHNHSFSTTHEYEKIFGKGNFINLFPDDLYHYYICNSGIVDPLNTILIAPDEGAEDFVLSVAENCVPFFPALKFSKSRSGESSVQLKVTKDSESKLSLIENKDVVVLDDMVRTGATISECCNILQNYNPNRIVFLVTHFYSSEEVKQKLSNSNITEIVTTNTIPSILNRDNQGRLRKKMVVLKIMKWIANYLCKRLELDIKINEPLYEVDISNKNKRAKAGFNAGSL